MTTPGVLVDVVDATDGTVPVAWWTAYDAAVFERRAAQGGVVAARRGTRVAGSVAGIVVYDLADIDVARSQEWGKPPASDGTVTVSSTLYRQLSSTVDDYSPPRAPILHAAFFEAEPGHHDEFNDWYEMEHVPAIVAVDGYENCRRFNGVDDNRRFLALYDVISLAVADGEEAAVATSSPWSDRVRAKIATYRERRVFEWDRVVPAPSV